MRLDAIPKITGIRMKCEGAESEYARTLRQTDDAGPCGIAAARGAKRTAGYTAGDTMQCVGAE